MDAAWPMGRSDLDAELCEQARWQVGSTWDIESFGRRLAENEFLEPAEQRRRQDAHLRRMLEHCAAHVPYWRDLFRNLGYNVDDLMAGAFHELPMLSRETVQSQRDRLRAERLPAGQALGPTTKTSGSTGQPVIVDHSLYEMFMYGLLKQRKQRWYRFDPKAKSSAIRPVIDLPKIDGREPDPGETVRRRWWPEVSRFYRTGVYSGLSNSTPVEEQAEWLWREEPDYLLMLSADLEHLALTLGERGAPSSLKVCETISQQLTPDMRERIQRILSVPVFETYGLNELGFVASQSPASTELLVQWEHVRVDATDDHGRTLPQGERGRLLVTSLRNFLMPLLRYDTDDVAALVWDGESACGRTMPRLERLMGRYRRNALLPSGTWSYWDRLQHALTHVPDELLAPLRQYQLHQFTECGFELRLVLSGELPAGLERVIREDWAQAGDQPLRIQVVDEIPRPGGRGKFQNFTSDHIPAPE